MAEEKERQLVEEYMREFCLEAVIDEVVNGVLETRPKNPYIEMSKLMEAKSMAEIVHIALSPVTTDTGSAVRATVSTNVDAFSACCGTVCDLAGTEDDLKDYSIVQEEVSGFLLGKSPTDIQKIDEIIQRIEGLDQSVAIALSMACARAGARHRGMELYQFLSEYGRTTPALPMPCVSVVSRVAGPDAAWNTHSQDVGVIPTTSSSFANALEAVMKAYCKAASLVVASKIPVVPSSSTGCPKVRGTIADILKIAHDAISVEGTMGGLKLVVDMRGADLAAAPPPPPDGAEDPAQAQPPPAALRYQVGGEAPVAEKAPEKKDKKGKAAAAEAAPASPRAETYSMSGAEFVDCFVNSWIDYEMISVEDPAHGDDLETLRLLKTKTTATLDSIKSSGGSKFEYAFKGVGEDSRCALQVVADAALAKAENLKTLSSEAVFDSVKVRPLRYRTVTEAINVCGAARQLGWAVIIGSEESVSETSDSFISDLAVAVGAGQFSCGGFGSGYFTAKLDRLLQISETDDSVLFVGRRFRC